MNKYKISFIGRKKNAKGKVYKITETVFANDVEGAKLKLYENYEHIKVLTLKQ